MGGVKQAGGTPMWRRWPAAMWCGTSAPGLGSRASWGVHLEPRAAQPSLWQAGRCTGPHHLPCRAWAHSIKGSPRLLMQYFCKPSSGP